MAKKGGRWGDKGTKGDYISTYLADFPTKPLQGKAFVKFWDLLMGAV